eukprot:PITA_23443
MLKDNNLSNEYWAEVVACAIYVINRYPKKSVINRVPEQAWSGMYCDISHLGVFGCVVYAHVPKKRRGKLDDKSEKCIFIGYIDAQVPLMEEDDVVEKEQQELQVKTPNRDTPTRTPRISEQHGSSSRSTDQGSSNNQSGDESSDGNPKMRSLKDIYDDLDVSSNFALLSLQPSSFEETTRDEN